MEMGAITLVPVVKESVHEQIVLKNLLKMYCYEWPQYNQLMVDEQWAGFVFFDTHDFITHTDCNYSMAEFLIMHAYRYRGIGRYVVTQLFDRYGGAWEIGCHPNNLSSVRFWQKVVGDYTLGSYKLMFSCPGLKYHDGTLGNVISFHTDTQ